jgi:hypothetical protein
MHQKTRICLICLLVSLAGGSNLSAQQHLFQLSGIVSDVDTKFPVAYANIEVVGEYRGVYTSQDGFFSCVVSENDTVQFSATGYKTKMYVVPQNMDDNIFSIAVLMYQDTLELEAVEIYPWPSKEEFRDAFLAYKEVQDYKIGPIPGIKGRDQIDTVPKPPVIYKNPISVLYEEVIVPIQWKKKKKDKAKELPKWND